MRRQIPEGMGLGWGYLGMGIGYAVALIQPPAQFTLISPWWLVAGWAIIGVVVMLRAVWLDVLAEERGK